MENPINYTNSTVANIKLPQACVINDKSINIRLSAYDPISAQVYICWAYTTSVTWRRTNSPPGIWALKSINILAWNSVNVYRKTLVQKIRFILTEILSWAKIFIDRDISFAKKYFNWHFPLA